MRSLRTEILYCFLLTLVAALILWPVFSQEMPYYFYSPDVRYAMAKVLAIESGQLFTDPVSGTITLHPIGFYLVLAAFVQTGLGIATLLMSATAFGYVGSLIFGFLVLRREFDALTSFLGTLLFPLTAQFMVHSGILLPRAWNFSIPFYLVGLWLLLSPRSRLKAVLIGLFWGIALSISSANVVLLGVHLIWLLWTRRDRYTAWLISAFAITALPLIMVQLWEVKQSGGLYEQDTFHAVPELVNPVTMTSDFIKTDGTSLSDPSSIFHIVFLCAFGAVAIAQRRFHWYVGLILIVYACTYAFFLHHYAPRVLMFSVLFMTAFMLQPLMHRPQGKGFATVLALIGVLAGVILNLVSVQRVQAADTRADRLYHLGQPALDKLASITSPGEFVLCDKWTYRTLVLPNLRVHGLGCHMTLAYFQVRKPIAEQFESDFRLLHSETDSARIESILTHYGLRAAMLHVTESFAGTPLESYLASHWKNVYHDETFSVFHKD